MPGMKPPSPDQVKGKLQTLATLVGVGIVRPQRPDRLLNAVVALLRWGATPAAGYKAAASRYPDDLAIIDESGTLTFRQVHERSNALAHALRAEGVGPGSRVGIMCRNHRGWVEAYVATNKLGAHALFMNTAFSGPQLADVAEREDPAAIIFDEEFAGVLEAATAGRKRFIAWHEPDGDRGDDRTLDELIEGGDTSDLAPPPAQGKALILTSGTTGTPKGASRKQPQSLDPVAALLEQHPAAGARADDDRRADVPLLGLRALHARDGPVLDDRAQAQVRPRGDAVAHRPARGDGADRRAGDAAADPRARRRGAAAATTSAPEGGPGVGLRAARARCRSAGWTCSATTSTTSTARPRWRGRRSRRRQDLRAAPGTAGRPPRGTTVRLYDEDELEVGPGETGRIFVGNDLAFEGYTGGGNKAVIDGMLSSGDVGHFDADGRLFIDGRDDDMIVSGGENVFPGEVEDLLAGPRGGRRGGRVRRRRRGVRPAAQGRRRDPRRAGN